MKKAFTLIELLVVLILIALISSVVAPKGHKLLESVSNKIAKQEKKTEKKLEIYNSFIGEKNILNDKNKIIINKFGIKIG